MKPVNRSSAARYWANSSYDMRKNDSASCTWPKACEVCITSPSLIAPLKKRGACRMNGNTTATWLTTKLKPSSFSALKTSAQTLAITAAKRCISVARSTAAPW